MTASVTRVTQSYKIINCVMRMVPIYMMGGETSFRSLNVLRRINPAVLAFKTISFKNFMLEITKVLTVVKVSSIARLASPQPFMSLNLTTFNAFSKFSTSVNYGLFASVVVMRMSNSTFSTFPVKLFVFTTDSLHKDNYKVLNKGLQPLL